MLKEKIGKIFSILKDNEPIKGCTISKTIYESEDFKITHFSLAQNTDISAESYLQDVLYLVSAGNVEISGKKLQVNDGIFIPKNTLFSVKADTACVYTEIIFSKEFKMETLKNLNAGEIFNLKSLLPVQDGKIVNMDLVSNDKMKLVLMSFDKGCALAEHAAPGEAVIFALEGQGIIGYEGKEFKINAGENFCFAKNGKHFVRAAEKFKMALLLLL